MCEIELRFKVREEVGCKHVSLVQSVPITSCHCSLSPFSGGELQEEIAGSELGREGRERKGREEGRGKGGGEREGRRGEGREVGVCGQKKQRMSYSSRGVQFDERHTRIPYPLNILVFSSTG